MKNMDDFRYAKEAIMCTTKWTPFGVSKDEWNIKEDTMKNALYVLRYAKRHF